MSSSYGMVLSSLDIMDCATKCNELWFLSHRILLREVKGKVQRSLFIIFSLQKDLRVN